MTDCRSASDSKIIPLAVPYLGGKEWEYVKECLDTNWVSSAGNFVGKFESMLAEHVGAQYAVATSSGTAALHLALLVSGVEPDDEVIVPTLTFIATANVVRYVGAWPVFVDAEPLYWQIDPNLLADFFRQGCYEQNGYLYNKQSGRRIRAIIPVHLLGHPCDMDLILELARQYNLVVVEDATESLGASYKGSAVGNLGDIACFSFNGNKLITTGGGGMIMTNNREWALRASHLSTQAKDDPVEYSHDSIGFNYRLTNIQAALGCAQVEQLSSHIEAKRNVSTRYTHKLSQIPGLSPMAQAPWAESACWLYTMLVDESHFGIGSRELLTLLDKEHIQSRPLFKPIHLSQPYRSHQAIDNGIANKLYRNALSLPCSVGLPTADQDLVCSTISEINASG